MDTAQAKEKLLARQEELMREMRRLGDDARQAQQEGVEDPIDSVESSEGKAANFKVNTIAAESLKQVQAALQRIDDGTYGTCIDCGRPVQEARLEAIPWTPYCLEDAEKHQREAPAPEAAPMRSSE